MTGSQVGGIGGMTSDERGATAPRTPTSGGGPRRHNGGPDDFLTDNPWVTSAQLGPGASGITRARVARGDMVKMGYISIPSLFLTTL